MQTEPELRDASSDQLCDFCQTVDVERLTGNDPEAEAKATRGYNYMSEILQSKDRGAWTKNGVVGPTFREVAENKTSCQLCSLIYSHLDTNETQALLANDRASTLAMRVVLKLVNVTGRHFNSLPEEEIAALSIELERLPGSGETLDQAKTGLRVFTAPGCDQTLRQRCASQAVCEDSWQTTFETIRSWKKSCMSLHDRCLRKFSGEIVADESTGSILPSRVLQISATGTLKLVETKVRQTGHYVALSYCWGKPGTQPFLQLHRNNLDDLKRGINRLDLPKTMQDALTVTEELGLELLWIDALCIMQESDTDWVAEVGAMPRIYQNATMTIAVLGDRDSFSGFLGPRKIDTRSFRLPWKPRTQTPTEFQNDVLIVSSEFSYKRSSRGGKRIMSGLEEDVARSRWNTRAWTFQENLLSRRVLYVADCQVYWQCQKNVQSEDGFDQKVEDYVDPIFDVPCTKAELFSLLGSKVGPDEHHSFKALMSKLTSAAISWLRKDLLSALTDQYSIRQLSVPTDKLAAFDGLISAVSNQHGRRNLAGVWFGDADATGLFWRLADGDVIRSTPLRAPTWSWACCDGKTQSRSTMHFVSELVDCISFLNTNPLMATSTRGIPPAALEMKARMLKIKRSSRLCAEMPHVWSQISHDICPWPLLNQFSSAEDQWPSNRSHLLFLESDVHVHSQKKDQAPVNRGCPTCGNQLYIESESAWISHVESCLSAEDRSEDVDNDTPPRDQLIGVAYFDSLEDCPETMHAILLDRFHQSTARSAPDFGTEVSSVNHYKTETRFSAPSEAKSGGFFDHIASINWTVTELTRHLKQELHSLEVLSHTPVGAATVLPYHRCKKSFHVRDLPKLQEGRRTLYQLLLVEPYDSGSNMYKRIGIATSFWLPKMGRFGGVDLIKVAPPKEKIILI